MAARTRSEDSPGDGRFGVGAAGDRATGSTAGRSLNGYLQRKVRIADVAREAGVSKTAVSFAFNSPERLNPATATRIRSVAENLGYRPQGGLLPASQKRTMTLGLLTPQVLSVIFENPFYGELCAGVASATDQAGYGLLFVSPVQGSLMRAVARATVDGFVAVGLSEDHPEVEQIRRAGLPMVIVDGGALPEHGLVESNDEVGARSAAKHLLSLGHRHFVVVGVEPPSMPWLLDVAPGPSETVTTRRLTGYRQALEIGGVKLHDEQIVVGPASFDGGVATFRRIWEDGQRPTAILAMSDVMAIGVMWAAREVGLNVPYHLSVVGFDDLDMAMHSNPPLTTVHQPVRAKGEEAARLLMRMIAHPDNERPEHRTLDTRLIIRGSTGPAHPLTLGDLAPGRSHPIEPGASARSR